MLQFLVATESRLSLRCEIHRTVSADPPLRRRPKRADEDVGDVSPELVNRPSTPRAIPTRTDTIASAAEPIRIRGEAESTHQESTAMSLATRSARAPSSIPVVLVAPSRIAPAADSSAVAGRLTIARRHTGRAARYPAGLRRPDDMAEEVVR